MVKIPVEMLNKYNMLSFEECMERHPGEEKTFYKTFLLQTDYIPMKMMEAQVTGETLDEDYTEVLEARKLCRQRLNALAKESEV